MRKLCLQVFHFYVAVCNKKHIITKVPRQTEEFIGQMKNHIPCLAPDCSSEYSMNSLKVSTFLILFLTPVVNDVKTSLQEALKRPSFYRLEKRRQAEEILAAGIEGFSLYEQTVSRNFTYYYCRTRILPIL